jgi:hypothetical protein
MACGIVVNEMAYQHNIKQGMTPEDATIEADKTTKKAIGSFNPLDLPQINYRLT